VLDKSLVWIGNVCLTSRSIMLQPTSALFLSSTFFRYKERWTYTFIICRERSERKWGI